MKQNFFSNNKKIKSKRLYIVLACCVLSISAIAFTTSLIPNENAPTENKNDNVKYSLPEPIEEDVFPNQTQIHSQPEESTVQSSSQNTKKSDAAKDQEYIAPASETFESSKLRQISYPINGKILSDYSVSPIHFSLTDDWRSHEALDLSANENDEIHAATDGKIEKIFSGIYGDTIIIDHENSMKTLYANLENKNNLKEGDRVKEGDVIAYAKNNSLCEKYSDNCHVHFEVMIDDKNINPHEWLKSQD